MNKLYPLCLLSLLLASATSLEVAAAAAEPTTHTLIATDCSQYFTWQTIGIVYTLRKSGHPGPLTRLVSCTQKEWGAFPQADKDLDAELGISTHVAPSYSVHPRTGDVYPGINKPVAVLDWMARTHVAEDFVLVIDADMVMRRPLLPQELGAAPGTAISGFFGYLVGVTNELALRHAAGVAPRQDTAAGPAGRRGDQVGGFTLMEREDLRRVLPLWLRISEDVRFDPEAWHLTGDAYAQHGERPWIAEMYGYSFGCARAGVWHTVHPTAMLYPGYEVGPEHAADPVRLLHYGILWNVSGTGYSFDKHWHYDFDALACPPWSLSSDPRHTKRGLFAHPPRPSALVLARLNEAFCDRHLRMCPPSEELHRECAVAQEIARELEEEYASLVIPPEEQAAPAEVQQPAGPQQEPGHHGQGSTGSIAEQPRALGQPTEGGMGAEEGQQHGGGVAAQEAAASGDADAGAAGGRGGADAGQVHAEL